ncbi:MAG: bifunctional diaminohydroxyphosphoribosylaminopyrimidine deaminase/5-amino-6-(5-phosphoribosylamino)uracil reductase RibD [Candidatus Omnitrophota bacterium]
MLKRESFNEKYMQKALQLAKRGKGRTFPNPLVGCVIVKNNKIVGEGFHKRFGAAHAEVNALKAAGEKAKGASLYVNLEPCAHFGKTPPCADAIIKSQVKEVIIGMKDPNPINNGKGIKKLRSAGIKVKADICREEAEELNAPFIKLIKTGSPFVTLKMAQSLDGKIATATGDSKWISSEESRKFVHGLRQRADAVMVGVGTVVADDPLLNVRSPFGFAQGRQGHRSPLDFARGRQVISKRQPVKVIVDSMLRTPLSSRIFTADSPAKTIIATTNLAPKAKVKNLLKKNVEILPVKAVGGKVDLKALMKLLINRHILNILIEGGGELAASALKEGIVDKILFFTAPKIIGGRNAKTSVEGEGASRIRKALNVKNITVKKIGCDFIIEGYMQKCSPEL